MQAFSELQETQSDGPGVSLHIFHGFWPWFRFDGRKGIWKLETLMFLHSFSMSFTPYFFPQIFKTCFMLPELKLGFTLVRLALEWNWLLWLLESPSQPFHTAQSFQAAHPLPMLHRVFVEVLKFEKSQFCSMFFGVYSCLCQRKVKWECI